MPYNIDIIFTPSNSMWPISRSHDWCFDIVLIIGIAFIVIWAFNMSLGDNKFISLIIFMTTIHILAVKFRQRNVKGVLWQKNVKFGNRFAEEADDFLHPISLVCLIRCNTLPHLITLLKPTHGKKQDSFGYYMYPILFCSQKWYCLWIFYAINLISAVNHLAGNLVTYTSF